MKKNLYYRNLYKRGNTVKEFFVVLFVSISSWPRLLLEVFIRRNFGERYFSFPTSVVIAIILIGMSGLSSIVQKLLFGSRYFDASPIDWSRWGTWYLFIAVFLFFAWKRRQEVKRNPSVFDLARFSLYAGDIHPAIREFKPFGKRLDLRQIETIVEPGLFMVVGIILIFLGQTVGYLIFVCGALWSLSMRGQYYLGDEFIMDKIDELIHNEDLTTTFVGDKTLDLDRGVRFFGRRPTNEEMRSKVAESFFEETTVEAMDLA